MKFASICLAILLGVNSAHATFVTASLTGSVTQIDGNVVTGAQVGDSVQWTAYFDSAASASSSGSGYSFWNFSSGPSYIRVDVTTSSGVLSFNSGPAGSGESLWIWNYDQSFYSPGDYLEISAPNQTGSNWPSHLFLSGGSQIITSMFDRNSPYDMVDGINLPAAGLPDLSKVTDFNGEIRGWSNTSSANYDIHWTMDVPGVPDAASTFWLLAAAFGALFAWGRRQTKRRA